MEKVDPLCTAGGDVSDAAALEDSVAVPQKIRCQITMWSHKSTSGYVPTITESRVSKRYLYIHVIGALFRIATR